MALLFVFSMVNSLTLFALGILLVRNAWSLGANVTTIESWEIERHEAIIKRAKVLGGYLDGPDGIRVKITRQEFPYDIGIFRNIQQAMGKNAHFWLWPFAPTPLNRCGLWFETNGFEGMNEELNFVKICLFGFIRFFDFMASSRSRSYPKATSSIGSRRQPLG